MEYEYDLQQYQTLYGFEKDIIEKFQKKDAPISEIVSDIGKFKYLWYKKRFDSELKRKVYG